MTPEQKLEIIEKTLAYSYFGSNGFPFHIIRQSVTKSIIQAIQANTNGPTFGISFESEGQPTLL